MQKIVIYVTFLLSMANTTYAQETLIAVHSKIIYGGSMMFLCFKKNIPYRYIRYKYGIKDNLIIKKLDDKMFSQLSDDEAKKILAHFEYGLNSSAFKQLENSYYFKKIDPNFLELTNDNKINLLDSLTALASLAKRNL